MWDALLDGSEQEMPFAALDFSEAIAATFGLGIRLAVALAADGSLAGGVTLFERQRGPYRTVVVPPLAAYTPFVLAQSLSETDVNTRRSVVDALLPFLERRYHALAFHLHPSFTDVRPFTWSGYLAQPRYTYVQAIDAPDVLLGRASKSVRKRIRRDGDRFIFAEDPGALGELSRLIEAVFDRQEAEPPLARDQRARVLRPLLGSGLARLFTLTSEGEASPSAVQALLSRGREAALLMCGSRPGAAQTVLIHRLGQMLHAEGVGRLDFVGANLPSVAEFKRSFGAPLATYYRVERYRRPELRALALARPFL